MGLVIKQMYFGACHTVVLYVRGTGINCHWGVAVRCINHNTTKAKKQFSHKEHEIKHGLPLGRVRVELFFMRSKFFIYLSFAVAVPAAVALLVFYLAQVIY